ncbi:MAG: cobalamin-dependent protein [Candidatus Aminicenantes bacterium]|nr:MAG: cobalamin-dependent protein [Candidatus Aminicenantes bacterium]
MSKVKILLMSVYNDKMMQNLEDIGICFIASFLRQEGHEVMITRVKEDAIAYDQIVDKDPGIIGFPVYDVSKESVYRVIERIKQLLPRVWVCVGGSLPTYSSVEMLEECPLIDFAVRGEGELTFWELVSQLPDVDGEKLGKIKGLTYRHQGMIKINDQRPLIPDINTLPLPARDILRDNDLKTAQISTSRGCQAPCSFCISNIFWKKWRGRKPEKVVDEIEYIVKEYGIKTFNFIDGSLEDPGPGVKRLWDLAAGMVKRKLNISYFADLRSEFHQKATSQLMELLKESGLCGVCVGFESANESDQKLYKKIASINDNIKFIELLRNYDINIEPGFINFNPYSTFAGLEKNIEFLEKYGFASNLDYIVNRYRMYKGTTLYHKIKRDSLLVLDSKCREYGYDFVEKRIGFLYDYIDGYLTTINKNTSSDITALAFYATKFFTLLNHLKRQFIIEKEDKGHAFVLQLEKQNSLILLEVNQQAAQWFKRLLTLAEAGWGPGKADEISNDILSADYINKTVLKLHQNKLQLYMKLVKLNLDSYVVSMG